MPTTVALVRWYGGWTEVENATGISNFGRREGFFSYGAQQSAEEVNRLASAELSGMFAKNREQMTAEHRPTDLSETPYVGGYIPSDRIITDDFGGTPTLYSVISLSVTEDVDGQLSFTPSVGDIIDGVDVLVNAVRESAAVRGPQKNSNYKTRR